MTSNTDTNPVSMASASTSVPVPAVNLHPVPTGSDSVPLQLNTQKPVRGTSVRISVPLDETLRSRRTGYTSQTTTVYGQQRLIRRDSLDRREAILKGKEGSRQRRRWENDRLLNNPHAEPPLPCDWEIRPTYPRRTIPYYLAPLWDAAEFQRAVESKLNAKKRNRRRSTKSSHKGAGLDGTDKYGNVYEIGMSPMEEAASSIPKEIRARLKHARSAKGLLHDLEEDVRDFVRRWNERELRLRKDGLDDAPRVFGSLAMRPKKTENDSAIMDEDEEEDEEIVFVGRNGAMHDFPASPSPTASVLSTPEKKKKKESCEQDEQDAEQGLIATERLICQGLESDKGASFARWLVHCVGAYYGLRTWSVTKEVDGECRREAYVGVDGRVRGFMGRGRCVDMGEEERSVELPRPLWAMV